MTARGARGYVDGTRTGRRLRVDSGGGAADDWWTHIEGKTGPLLMLPRTHPDIAPEPAFLTDFALRFEVELPGLVEEIINEVWWAVPEIARICRDHLGTDARIGTDEGIRQTLDLLASPHSSPAERATVYRWMGRLAYQHGISLDSLQTAFRVGTQIAWRRLSALSRRTGSTAEHLRELTDTLFATVDEASAHALRAYTDLSDRDAESLGARRRHLLEVLLTDPPPGGDVIADVAKVAQWHVPRAIACVILDEPWHAEHPMPPALDPDVLMGLQHPDSVLLVPDPEGPGRLDMLRRGLRGVRFAVGTTVDPGEAAVSLRTARHALSLMRRGVLPDSDHILSSTHLPALLLLSDEDVTRQLVQRRMAGFAELSRGQRARLRETLLAWLTLGGSVPQVAARLSVHPQTIRYRMRRLQELFGDRLHEPEWRFEMLLALHADRLINGPEAASGGLAAS